MPVRVAINGFGRIGRLVLRSIIEFARRDIEVVAINDLGPVATNAHLLRFDSVHGRLPAEVVVEGDVIKVAGHTIKNDGQARSRDGGMRGLRRGRTFRRAMRMQQGINPGFDLAAASDGKRQRQKAEADCQLRNCSRTKVVRFHVRN